MTNTIDTTSAGIKLPYFWPLVQSVFDRFVPAVSDIAYRGLVGEFHIIDMTGQDPDPAAVDGALGRVGNPPIANLKRGFITPGPRGSSLPDLCSRCGSVAWYACTQPYEHQIDAHGAALRHYAKRLVRPH